MARFELPDVSSSPQTVRPNIDYIVECRDNNQ